MLSIRSLFSSPRVTSTLTIAPGFSQDMRRDAWVLLGDTDDPVEFRPDDLRLVRFPNLSEIIDEEGNVHPSASSDGNFGQRHGEALVKNHRLISTQWLAMVGKRGAIPLLGSRWRHYHHQRIVLPCIDFSEGRWRVNFQWLVDLRSSACYLLCDSTKHKPSIA